ncbi:MAG: VCBS domain-containing protein, partial [Sedimenticolaceae bacterium]
SPVFNDVASTTGDNGYGSFALSSGAWTYTLDQSTVQDLDAGDVVTDTITYTATDGSTQLVSVTITGTDDASVVTGGLVGTVTEGDVGDAPVTANGVISILDPDSDDNPIFNDVPSTFGDNAYGSFELNGGAWTYTLNQVAVQFLGVGDVVTDTYTFTATDGNTQVITITINGTEDAPVIGGVSTGAVTEDVDPDLDALLEATGALTINDPDAGESAFVAGTVAGSHGHLVIDASGNWSYEADNAQAAVQGLDAGENINDVLTVNTADGTAHNITVTINGAEDAPVIAGSTSASVTEDGTVTAGGTLTITDADLSDNPVSFPDEAGTPGDNGYGEFKLSGGSWSYALNNAHAAVQALGAGASLTDTHTFTASDGSTQVVSILIAGAPESPAFTQPLSSESVSKPIERPAPPPETEEPVETPVDEDPAPESTVLAGPTDPASGEPEIGGGLTSASNPRLPDPLQPDEIFLSVIADARPNDAPGIQKVSAPVVKPGAESSHTFLQELKSFWKDDSTTTSLEMSEVRFSKDFWGGLDKMAQDLDEAMEDEDKKTHLSAEAAAGVGISLTAGFVSWALRAGSMAASLLAAMPTWRHFDPMPVLAADDKKKQDPVSSDDTDEETRESDKNERIERLFGGD